MLYRLDRSLLVEVTIWWSGGFVLRRIGQFPRRDREDRGKQGSDGHGPPLHDLGKVES